MSTYDLTETRTKFSTGRNPITRHLKKYEELKKMESNFIFFIMLITVNFASPKHALSIETIVIYFKFCPTTEQYNQDLISAYEDEQVFF